jgi:sec-independent protein translocase protein TatA
LPEILLILAVALLIFGPSKLADLGKGLGEGIKNFKSAVKDGERDSEKKS